MHKAKLKLNNKEFIGTLTFEVLINSIRELEKIGKILNIPSLFIALGSEDLECITALIIQSIVVLEKHSEDEISETYTKENTTQDEKLENFCSMFSYMNELFKKCVPLKEQTKKDSIFDDEEEEFDNAEDWDIAEFEYIWETVLKRDSFYKITPKTFFEQLDIHNRANKTNDSNVTEM